MVIAWRVVAIDTDGTQIVVDEGLTDERALQVARVMLTKGHTVIIEAEPRQRLPGFLNLPGILTRDDAQSDTSDPSSSATA